MRFGPRAVAIRQLGSVLPYTLRVVLGGKLAYEQLLSKVSIIQSRSIGFSRNITRADICKKHVRDGSDCFYCFI